jgi:hypothetical protein
MAAGRCLIVEFKSHSGMAAGRCLIVEFKSHSGHHP